VISKAELEALELLVKSGKVAPQAQWEEVIPEVTKYIVDLAKRLISQEEQKNDAM
jgi:hypothetical protein